MNKKTGFLALLFTSFIFSSFGLFSRILSQQLTDFQQLTYRYFVGIFVVLGIIYIIRKQKLSLKKFLNRKILLFAILTPFAFYFTVRSFLESPLSVAISGFYAGMIFTGVLIGTLLLKEKMSLKGIIGLILVVIAFLFLNDLNIKSIVNIGLVWGLISGIAYGVTSFLKKDLKQFTKEELLLVISVSVTVVIQTLSFINKEPLALQLTTTTIVTILAFLSVALVAEYLTIVGFRNFNLYLGTIILSLEIVFTILVGFIFYHEQPSLPEWIGILFIIMAVVLTNLPDKKQLLKSLSGIT